VRHAVRSVRNARFRKAFEKLPDVVQRVARDAYERFRANPFDPTLKLHPIQGSRTPGVYAVDAGTHRGTAYRALGIWHKGKDVIVWFWIGSHEEYNQIIKRL
jgi:hypothetical protein